MPRYFFHCVDGGSDPDAEGTELPNLDAARSKAVRVAAKIIQVRPDLVWKGRNLRIEVTDRAGMLLCAVAVLGIDAPIARGPLTGAA